MVLGPRRPAHCLLSVWLSWGRRDTPSSVSHVEDFRGYSSPLCCSQFFFRVQGVLSGVECYVVLRGVDRRANKLSLLQEGAVKDRRTKFPSVEGSNRSRRHRHVTISPNEYLDVNDSGDVTKIELELEEAPDDAVLVASVPSELDATAEINSTYPDGFPEPGTVVVRAEEALLVVLVMVIWVAAIALFFNRWGKIRMLEPYQPKFQQQHRPSCIIDPNPLQTRTSSKFNVHCADFATVHDPTLTPLGAGRPRQNSVFVGAGVPLIPAGEETPRRTKSAFNLQSLVLSECEIQSDQQDALPIIRPSSESSKLLQADRRRSVCQFDRNDFLVKSPLRERGMSICQFDRIERTPQRTRGMSFSQFDRMDVLARPLQRDRGASICQFDRMDVLARPLPKERGSVLYHFDRKDVLARPTIGKSLLRERRVSICNYVERDEEAAALREKRTSIKSIERVEKLQREETGSGGDIQEIFAKCTPRKETSHVYQLDRPSCSKTPDVVLGYKATCV